jgi:hypothetical protein
MAGGSVAALERDKADTKSPINQRKTKTTKFTR